MRLRRNADRRWRVEHWLVVAGFTCLTIFLWNAARTEWFQWRYLQELRAGRTADASPVLSAAALRSGPLGLIEIPRARISAAILDGVGADTLDLAVGHVPGTAFPGDLNGRVALAAHRDSFFRNLGALKKGDTIRLIAGRQDLKYEVETTSVVNPEQTEVLAPTEDSLLTLVTCYPFHFIGPAPQRFIVQARRVAD